jgi:hypothetical protein
VGRWALPILLIGAFARFAQVSPSSEAARAALALSLCALAAVAASRRGPGIARVAAGMLAWLFCSLCRALQADTLAFAGVGVSTETALLAAALVLAAVSRTLAPPPKKVLVWEGLFVLFAALACLPLLVPRERALLFPAMFWVYGLVLIETANAPFVSPDGKRTRLLLIVFLGVVAAILGVEVLRR